MPILELTLRVLLAFLSIGYFESSNVRGGLAVAMIVLADGVISCILQSSRGSLGSGIVVWLQDVIQAHLVLVALG